MMLSLLSNLQMILFFSFYVVGTPVQSYSNCISCDWSYAFNHYCHIMHLEKVNFVGLTIT